MPNTDAINLYEQYLKMGMSSEEAGLHLDIDKDMLEAYEKAKVLPSDDAYALEARMAMQAQRTYTYDGALEVGRGLRKGSWAPGTLTSRTPEQDDAAEAIRQEAMNNKPLWRDIVDVGMGAIDVLATPQQMIWAELSGGNWRTGVGTWLINRETEEAWANEGLDKVYLDFGDVVDSWTGGGYEGMLGDLKEGGWFEKWALRGGLKIAEFGADALLDPVNLLVGAGLGKKLVNAGRRALPAEITAEMTSRVALAFENPVNYKRAVSASKKLVAKYNGLHKVEQTTESAAKLRQATKDYVRIMNRKADFEGRLPFVVMPTLAPVKYTVGARKALNGMDIDPVTRGLLNARNEALDSIKPLINYADMDDAALAMRMGLGPDDAEAAGEAMRRMGMGLDAGSVTVRRLLDDALPTESSGTLFLDGIGRNGRVTQEYVERSRTVHKLADGIGALDAKIEFTKRALGKKANISKANKPGKAKASGRRAVDKRLEADAARVDKVIDDAGNEILTPKGAGVHGPKGGTPNYGEMADTVAELSKRRDAMNQALEHYNKHGVFPEELMSHLKIDLPGAPRRPLSSTDYLKNTFGNQMRKMVGHALYPESYMPKPGYLFRSFYFREPMRVLDESMPGGWDFIRGKTKMAEAERNALSGKMRNIFEKRGIYDVNQAQKGIGKITKHLTSGREYAPTRINKRNNEILAELLDTKHLSDAKDAAGKSIPTKEWTDILEKHGLDEASDVVQANHEIREVMDEIGIKLGLNEDEFVEGYLTHFFNTKGMVDPSWFNNGGRPPEFWHMNHKVARKLPGFLQERTGNVAELGGAVELLDLYTRAVTKHLHTNPMIDEFSNLVSHRARTAQMAGDHKMANNIQKYWTALRSNISGEPSSVAQFLYTLPGGEVFHHYAKRTAGAIGALTYSAALSGNPRYPVMAIAQMFNSTAAEYGPLRTLRAFASMMKVDERVMAKAAGMDSVHRQMMEDGLGMASKMAADVGIPVLMPSITDTEFFIRGVTMHASIGAQLTELGYKNLDDIVDGARRNEVLAQAIRDSESINHMFGVLGKPVAFGRISQSGSAIASQFMSFPFKQTETIGAFTRKNPGYLWDYLVLSGQMVRLGHKMGIHAGDYVGVGYAKDSVLVQSDRSSMPMEVIKESISYFGVAASMESTTADRIKAKERWQESLNSLIPGVTAMRHAEKRIRLLTKGEVRNTKGELIKDGVEAVDEFGTLITGMKGHAGVLRDISREKKRTLKSDQFARLYKVQRNIHDMAKNGKPFDPQALNEYNMLMTHVGMPALTNKQMVAMLNNEQARYRVEEMVREYDEDSSMWKVQRLAEEASPYGPGTGR